MPFQMRYIGVIVCLVLTVAMLGCAGNSTTKSTGQVVDDNAIAAKVKSGLVADPNVKGMSVNVDVFKGVVQLSGFVDSATTAQKAVSIARNVEGVKEVRNSLVVK
jgi:osmotically-inducible protein OsmY